MKIIKFTLEPDRDYVELNQLLKLVGLASSGGMGKAMVASGIVRVNANVELRKTCKIIAGTIVQIEDHEIHVVSA
jgi:ribosome-associated protein